MLEAEDVRHVLYVLEVLEVMCCVLLCMLDAVDGGLGLVEVLEALEASEVQEQHQCTVYGTSQAAIVSLYAIQQILCTRFTAASLNYIDNLSVLNASI
jgi:hypothetical protein